MSTLVLTVVGHVTDSQGLGGHARWELWKWGCLKVKGTLKWLWLNPWEAGDLVALGVLNSTFCVYRVQP